MSDATARAASAPQKKKGAKRKANDPAAPEGLEDKRRREREEKETARRRALLLQSGQQRKHQLPANLVHEELALPVSSSIGRCHGGHIKSRKQDKRRRYLFSFPGGMRLHKDVAGQLGTIEGLDTACPSVILDCGIGRILLRGVQVPAKGRLLNLQPKSSGADPRDLIVTDQFDYVIGLSEYTWVGTAEENPDLKPMPFPDGVLESKENAVLSGDESDSQLSQSQALQSSQPLSQSQASSQEATKATKGEEAATDREQEQQLQQEEDADAALRRSRRSTGPAKTYQEVDSDEPLELSSGSSGEGDTEQTSQRKTQRRTALPKGVSRASNPNQKAGSDDGKRTGSTTRPVSTLDTVVLSDDTASESESPVTTSAVSKRPRRASAAGPKRYKEIDDVLSLLSEGEQSEGGADLPAERSEDEDDVPFAKRAPRATAKKTKAVAARKASSWSPRAPKSQGVAKGQKKGGGKSILDAFAFAATGGGAKRQSSSKRRVIADSEESE